MLYPHRSSGSTLHSPRTLPRKQNKTKKTPKNFGVKLCLRLSNFSRSIEIATFPPFRASVSTYLPLKGFAKDSLSSNRFFFPPFLHASLFKKTDLKTKMFWLDFRLDRPVQFNPLKRVKMKVLDLLCSEENQRIKPRSFSGTVTLRTTGGIAGILTTSCFWNYLDLPLPERP